MITYQKFLEVMEVVKEKVKCITGAREALSQKGKKRVIEHELRHISEDKMRIRLSMS